MPGVGSDVPDFPAAREHVLGELVRFGRTLRANGANVPATAALSAAEALATVGLDDRERVAAATAATMLVESTDRETFDEQFPTFWYRLRTGLEAVATTDSVGDRAEDGSRGLVADDGPASIGADGEPEADGDGDADADGDPGDAGGDREVLASRVSDRRADAAPELAEDDPGTRTRSSTYSGAGEGDVVDGGAVPVGEQLDRTALRRFERALATLAGRRWTPGAGDRVDARRALRESVGTGGVPVSLPRRERRRSALRWTILVDVSRSVLDTVDRGFLLSFLDAVVADGRTVRVFFFDTEIREVTDAFAGAGGVDPAAALAGAEVAWGGGTRIGDAFAAVRTRWPGAVDRRTVTLVVSDGLDVGEVDRLEAGTTWLARRAAALVWLNPLAASPAYEPTCRGMAAALPYVDALFAFAGPDDVREVARQLERHGPGGPVGFEHDFRDRRDDDANPAGDPSRRGGGTGDSGAEAGVPGSSGTTLRDRFGAATGGGEQ